MNFIVNERLKWTSMEPRGEPLQFTGMFRPTLVHGWTMADYVRRYQDPV